MSDLIALDKELRRVVKTYSGKCTYALTDISSGEHIGNDEDDLMPTASLIKVPILIALYQAVEDGRISLDDRITFGDEHRFPGSGVLQRMSTGVEMSVRDAAVLIIIISDNVATNMLADLVGHDFIHEQQRSMGRDHTPKVSSHAGHADNGLEARFLRPFGQRSRIIGLSMSRTHNQVIADTKSLEIGQSPFQMGFVFCAAQKHQNICHELVSRSHLVVAASS